ARRGAPRRRRPRRGGRRRAAGRRCARRRCHPGGGAVTAGNRPGLIRLLVTPLAVAAGIGVAYAVFLSLSPFQYDSFILNRVFIQDRFVRHLELVGISSGAATLVVVSLGPALAVTGRWLRVPVFFVANLGQAVPSIGVLALFYAALGLGVRPAV